MQLRAALEMVLDGLGKADEVHTVDDVRRHARRALPRMVFDFVDGGAEAERTLAANTAAFDAVTFAPAALVDVGEPDSSTTVLGEPVAFPFLLAPAGLATMVHPDGEVAAARAAADAGTVFTVSTGSGRSLEEVAAAAGHGRLWFQLYYWRDEDVVDGLVARARDAGYEALVLTVDTPVAGNRERDLRNGMTLPPRIRPGQALDAATRVSWLLRFLTGPPLAFANLGDGADAGTGGGGYVQQHVVDPSRTWSDLDTLRRAWPGPLLVKGVLTPADASAAVDRGADGVIVSNHGGRQLDSAPASLAALPHVVEAVGDRAEVLVDGGVRRGSDVVKARALGARAVLAGRPWVFALARGEPGIGRMLEIVRAEVERTLALLGRRRFDEVDASALWPPSTTPATS